MSWYRELSQRQRLLMVAVFKRVTVTELAVMIVLVNQPDMSVYRLSELWTGRLLLKEDRPVSSTDWPLPYTRQGISKAVDALEQRGWLKRSGGYSVARWDPEITLLPINILSEAPTWLRADGKGSSCTSTSVAQRSRVNKRSKRSRDPKREPAGSDGVEAADLSPAHLGNGRYSYTVKTKGGK